jgi:rare lipoprotein A (peptidoglycan hydrolase)
MVNSNKMRISALLTLTFVVTMMASLFATGLSNGIDNTNRSKMKAQWSVMKTPKAKKKETSPKQKTIEKKKVQKPKAKEVTNEVNIRKHDPNGHHLATWYRTEGSIVHRDHPTAAYNFTELGAKLLVINATSGDSCIVEVTDRMGHKRGNHIDLSHAAFGRLGKHGQGVIRVLVKLLN